MPLSIRSGPADTISPNWPAVRRRRRDTRSIARQAQRNRGRWSATARAIKEALAPFGVPLVINDRIDVALAAGADGVHVGPDDMAVEDARRLLGPGGA